MTRKKREKCSCGLKGCPGFHKLERKPDAVTIDVLMKKDAVTVPIMHCYANNVARKQLSKAAKKGKATNVNLFIMGQNIKTKSCDEAADLLRARDFPQLNNFTEADEGKIGAIFLPVQIIPKKARAIFPEQKEVIF